MDVLIVGGSAGGTAAALAAADAGAFVTLLEETEWLGGQLTSQGVCTPDEQRYIESFGGTRRYMAFRDSVRNHYRTNYTLSAAALQSEFLNPGDCWVSRLSFEPRIGAQILREMTRPFEESGRLQIHFGARAVSCDMDTRDRFRINRVTAVLRDGREIELMPRIVLDATDLGDLLPMCGEAGADWTAGAESRGETGEPDAPEEAMPHWVQPFTFPFALDWSPQTAATNVIEPPEDYARLKETQKYHIKQGAITGLFAGAAPWWRYRRVLATGQFDDDRVPADVAMINTAGNDFYGGNVIGSGTQGRALSPADAEKSLEEARRASLGYLYWLQTECVREVEDLRAAPGGGADPSTAGQRGYPEFRLRKDLFDTADGCSPRPYIRESRRIASRRPIREQEIVVRSFDGETCRGDLARAAFMSDSVGIGHYALDIHPNGHGEPNHYVPTRPFQIPLGALIPLRLTNLLPACKNLGVTHLTNGAYRLHPIEWNIGESAGLLAAWCVMRLPTPCEIYESKEQLAAFQQSLISEGIALHWYVDVAAGHPAFAAVQWLAGFGITLGLETDLLFRPDEPMEPETYARWARAAGLAIEPPPREVTRAQAAVRLYEHARRT